MSKNEGRIMAIVNASSGTRNDEAQVDRIRESFARHGLSPRIELADDGRTIDRIAREAVDAGVEVIVAGGGDGTINTVACHVAGSRSTLGVLPMGTLNHFAKDLGIPLDLDDAVDVIAGGRSTLVDTGEVNGHRFINNSSIGIYPAIVRYREEQRRRGSGKWIAFLRATLRVLARHPFLNVRIEVDGKPMIRHTPFVFIGNNAYEIHGLEIGTRSRIDDGKLSLYVTHDIGRWGLVSLAFRGLFGRLRDAEDFDAIEATSVRIEPHGNSIRVALDGEVKVLDTPLVYTACRGVLRVMVAGSR